MGAATRVVRHLYVFLDDVELGTLFVDHMCNVAEQLVELANRLLYVADLRLALDDERFLKVDLVLIGEAELLLFLLLL